MSSSVETLVNREYKHGWVTDIESDTVPLWQRIRRASLFVEFVRKAERRIRGRTVGAGWPGIWFGGAGVS